MSYKNKKNIEDIYKNKSFSILSVPITRSEYLVFDYSDFQKVVNLLKEEWIKVSSVELYDKKDYDFYPPSFFYDKPDIVSCYLELDMYIASLIDCNSSYYAIDIITDNHKAIELKVSLDKISTLKNPLNKNQK